MSIVASPSFNELLHNQMIEKTVTDGGPSGLAVSFVQHNQYQRHALQHVNQQAA
jgi:hypothetical protein